MQVTGVNGITQLDPYGAAAVTPAANRAQSNPAMPEDTVTLSPAAQAQQTEQKVAAAAAQNMQTEMQTAANVTQSRELEAKLAQAAAQAQSGDLTQAWGLNPAYTPAHAVQLWMSTLALIGP